MQTLANEFQTKSSTASFLKRCHLMHPDWPAHVPYLTLYIITNECNSSALWINLFDFVVRFLKQISVLAFVRFGTELLLPCSLP